MDWESIKTELQKPLDPRHVKPPPAGKYGDYVDGYHVVSEANRIFGEDGWSYTVTRLELVSRADAKDRNGNPQVRVGYLATVRVQVGDTFKEGAAVGSGMARIENEADAHESAVKEAETDALKRALRTYGNTFGLALYDKTQANVRVDEPPFNHRAAADAIIAAFRTCQDISEVATQWAAAQPDIKRLKDDKPPMFGEVVKAKDEAKARLTPSETSDDFVQNFGNEAA